jgi:hypothetical protein
VAIQATPTVQAVPEVAENALMENPLWMLAPWALVAVGAGVKFWRLTRVFRQRVASTTTSTERFRQTLEQNWEKDEQAA